MSFIRSLSANQLPLPIINCEPYKSLPPQIEFVKQIPSTVFLQILFSLLKKDRQALSINKSFHLISSQAQQNDIAKRIRNLAYCFPDRIRFQFIAEFCLLSPIKRKTLDEMNDWRSALKNIDVFTPEDIGVIVSMLTISHSEHEEKIISRVCRKFFEGNVKDKAADGSYQSLALHALEVAMQNVSMLTDAEDQKAHAKLICYMLINQFKNGMHVNQVLALTKFLEDKNEKRYAFGLNRIMGLLISSNWYGQKGINVALFIDAAKKIKNSNDFEEKKLIVYLINIVIKLGENITPSDLLLVRNEISVLMKKWDLSYVMLINLFQRELPIENLIQVFPEAEVIVNDFIP